MKLAGSKNPGAWYRFNRWLKKSATGTSKTDLATVIAALDTAAPYFQALVDLNTAIGATDTVAASIAALATVWTTEGIPLEVWMGRLETDTYTKGVNTAGKTIYTADHAKEANDFGSDLRHACRQYRFVKRMFNDIRNSSSVDNPGGIADATPGN